MICGPYRDRAEGALASLLRQTALDRMEVVVVDCASKDAPPLAGSDHPRVRLLTRPGNYDLGSSRVEVLENTTAPLVWFLEEHSVAFPACAEALIDTHAEDWAAVAPEVRRFPDESFKSRILNCRFTPWISPAERGDVDALMGHNVCYKRTVLETYRDHLADRLNCEYLFHLELSADGHRLTMEPRAGIHHGLEASTWHIARGVMNYERMHAAQRRRRTDLTGSRMVLATLLGPLLKPVQTAVHTIGRDSGEWAPAIFGLPHLALIASGSSAGRIAAWIAGQGSAAERLGRIELDTPRLWWPEEPVEQT